MVRMAEGDQAVLYVARGAFHNPTRDEGRAVGIVTVAGTPRRRDVLIGDWIGHRRYGFLVEFIPEIILGERDGPPLKALVGMLKFVRQRAVWGMYFRRNPVEVEEADFRTIARAIETWKMRQSQGDRTRQDTRGDAVRRSNEGPSRRRRSRN